MKAAADANTFASITVALAMARTEAKERVDASATAKIDGRKKNVALG